MCSKEAIATTKELVTILASSDDEEGLLKIAKTFSEVKSTRCVQEDEVKTAIEQLRQVLSLEETKASTKNDEESLEDVGTLKAEKETTEKHIGKLECSLKDLEKSVGEKERNAREIQEKKANISNNRDEVLPKSKYNFSLYTNITHIRWEYDGVDDRVKGFVASLKDVRPFSLCAKQNSKFFIVNYLWDLIDV